MFGQFHKATFVSQLNFLYPKVGRYQLDVADSKDRLCGLGQQAKSVECLQLQVIQFFGSSCACDPLIQQQSGMDVGQITVRKKNWQIEVELGSGLASNQLDPARAEGGAGL